MSGNPKTFGTKLKQEEMIKVLKEIEAGGGGGGGGDASAANQQLMLNADVRYQNVVRKSCFSAGFSSTGYNGSGLSGYIRELNGQQTALITVWNGTSGAKNLHLYDLAFAHETQGQCILNVYGISANPSALGGDVATNYNPLTPTNMNQAGGSAPTAGVVAAHYYVVDGNHTYKYQLNSSNFGMDNLKPLYSTSAGYGSGNTSAKMFNEGGFVIPQDKGVLFSVLADGIGSHVWSPSLVVKWFETDA